MPAPKKENDPTPEEIAQIRFINKVVFPAWVIANGIITVASALSHSPETAKNLVGLFQFATLFVPLYAAAVASKFGREVP
jgi:hypothetical protein